MLVSAQCVTTFGSNQDYVFQISISLSQKNLYIQSIYLLNIHRQISNWIFEGYVGSVLLMHSFLMDSHLKCRFQQNILC